MKAMIKNIFSPDVDMLETYQPEKNDEFSFLLQLIVGPEGEEGEEAFNIEVCTPKWIIASCNPEDIIVGRHRLIVLEYNYERLTHFLTDFCSRCIGDDWHQVVSKVSRLGHWEFEDYRD